MQTVDDTLTFNGIDASNGSYLHPPTTAAELAELILAERAPSEDHATDLRLRIERNRPRYALEYGRDPDDLARAGWALVAASDTPRKVLAALEPLCAHRRELAGDLFATFTGEDGVQPQESKGEWLRRHAMGPGPADPKRVPYYLMLVGGPESISFRFQYELDVQYAVGRVAFDTAREYEQYATKVVAADRTEACTAPRLALFGPANADDPATALSAEHLLAPMAAEIVERAYDCRVTSAIGAAATKRALLDLLCAADAPELLFTASHGLGLASGDQVQRDVQGALLCQDWPGPNAWRNRHIHEDFYLAASDVDGARARARLVFAFACFGAGTPHLDDFDHLGGRRTRTLTRRPFVARLPQRLLSDPDGLTLAFVGHVERAWGCSFYWPGAGAQRGVFTSTLASVLDGRRVGHALEYLNARYAELAAELSVRIAEVVKARKRVNAAALAELWIATNDARGYVVLGDPAVRIERAPTTRPRREQPAS